MGHDRELGPGMRAVESAQQAGRGEPPADHVDPQRAAAGTLRACWPIGLAFTGYGVAGIVLVVAVQLGLVTSGGVFNPVLATYRLGADRAGPGGSHPVRLAMAGLLLLATPLLLPQHSRADQVSESSGPVLAGTRGPDPGPGPADPADARVKQVQG